MNVAVTVTEEENALFLQGTHESDEDEMPLSHEEANFFSGDKEDASDWKEVSLHKIEDLVINENHCTRVTANFSKSSLRTRKLTSSTAVPPCFLDAYEVPYTMGVEDLWTLALEGIKKMPLGI